MTEEPNPSGHPDLVTFVEARSAFEARIIVAVLEDSGIPAFVPGGLLTDEFAMSQRLLNLQGVDVQVPSDRLDDARRALEAAKASGEALASEVGEESPGREEVAPPDREPKPPGGSGLGTKMGLALLAIVFGYLWLETRSELAYAVTSPLYESAPSDDGFVYRWNHNSAVAWQSIDRDRNGIPEVLSVHNRDGVLTNRSHDADQNGIWERAESMDRSGRVSRVAEDSDQDGWFERVREFHPDGVVLVWRDTDGDDVYDRLELEDGGAAVLVQELRGANGFVPAR